MNIMFMCVFDVCVGVIDMCPCVISMWTYQKDVICVAVICTRFYIEWLKE